MPFLSNLEKEAQRRLQPLLQRFTFVRRQEVRHLSRRISQLERYLRSHPAEFGQRPQVAAVSALTSLKHADLFWDEV